MKAYAKINLSLAVTGVRVDGYHDIESIMSEIEVYDTLEIFESDKFELEIKNSDLPSDRRNLVYRAYELLSRHVGKDLPAKIVLNKNIPIMAGLAGGSSDSAATLKLLREFHGLGVSDAEMKRIASEIGSDVPFFIDGFTQFASGRGTELMPLPKLELDNLLLVNPGIEISTPVAYSWYDIDEKMEWDIDKRTLIELAVNNEIKKFLKYTKNELYPSVAKRYPEIESILKTLNAAGANGLMSGSGSTVFGAFDTEADMKNMAEYFEAKGYRCICTRTRRR